ncbi:MAG: hypothetical protein U0168_25365 [Nannocystaceae bacterium]
MVPPPDSVTQPAAQDHDVGAGVVADLAGRSTVIVTGSGPQSNADHAAALDRGEEGLGGAARRGAVAQTCVAR